LACLVKGATQLCTSKNECNKLDLTADQYFWLVDHYDWSTWFAISSPHIYANTTLLVRFQKKPAKLRHLILLSRVTCWAPVGMLWDLWTIFCIYWNLLHEAYPFVSHSYQALESVGTLCNGVFWCQWGG
jgi:hypothetical protein